MFFKIFLKVCVIFAFVPIMIFHSFWLLQIHLLALHIFCCLNFTISVFWLTSHILSWKYFKKQNNFKCIKVKRKHDFYPVLPSLFQLGPAWEWLIPALWFPSTRAGPVGRVLGTDSYSKNVSGLLWYNSDMNMLSLVEYQLGLGLGIHQEKNSV